MKTMFYIKTDEELFEMDISFLCMKDMYSEDNVAKAYLKNLVMYPYTVDEEEEK